MSKAYCDSHKKWVYGVVPCSCEAENRCKSCIKKGIFSSNHTQPLLQQQKETPIFEKSSENHPLSLSQRYAIIILHLLQKYNNDQISQLVNCHINSVKRWIHRFEAAEKFDEEAVSDLPREGRPRCSSPSEDDDVIDFALAAKFITPSQIKKELNSSSSISTIKRRLYDADLHCRIARVEYPFTDEHIEKRLKFADG
jgi:transposase